jgi:hypothetical protein
MKPTSLSRPNEQRKVETLLARLAKIKPATQGPLQPVRLLPPVRNAD